MLYVAAHCVIFEITESASINNLSATQSMIKRLNDLGCHFSLMILVQDLVPLAT